MRALLSYFWLLSGELIWKISPFLICEILGLLIKTLTGNKKHRAWDSVNLLPQIQKHLFQKQKTFSEFLVHFLEFPSIFRYFEKKKNIVIANVFPKLKTVKVLVKPLSKKLCFKRSFDSQHVKWPQTFVKSAWEHIYHIFSSLWGEETMKISPLLTCEL